MTGSTHPWVRSIAPMRSGRFVPIFDALADPALVARLSAEAEEAGWDERGVRQRIEDRHEES